MTIQYALYKNKLATAKNKTFTAKVKSYRSITEDALLDELADRGTTLTKTDIKAVLELLSESIERNLSRGNTINLPFANFIPVIKGTFNDPNDQFRDSRHKISFSVSLGNRLRKLPKRGLRVKKIRPLTPRPVIEECVDLTTNTVDTRITPGGLAKLSGFSLKLDNNDEKQGIFLRIKGKKKIRITQYGQIRARDILFLIPEGLKKGNYSLEVYARFGSILRYGIFKKELCVE